MIYLLHLDEKFSHTQHYLGWAQNFPALKKRVLLHATGYGSTYTKHVYKAGIRITVARIFPGDRNEERRLKNCKMAPRYCHCCQYRKDRNKFLEQMRQEVNEALAMHYEKIDSELSNKSRIVLP